MLYALGISGHNFLSLTFLITVLIRSRDGSVRKMSTYGVWGFFFLLLFFLFPSFFRVLFRPDDHDDVHIDFPIDGSGYGVGFPKSMSYVNNGLYSINQFNFEIFPYQYHIHTVKVRYHSLDTQHKPPNQPSPRR